jgi:hypothetical protein
MATGEGIICFCYRKSLADLQQGVQTHGSLERMQDAMRVGLACGGCRAMLHHHFGGGLTEINDFSVQAGGTTCMKPGNRTMKGFIGSSSLFESHIYSCNAVPLQLGECDATTAAEFVIYNHDGKPIYSRPHRVKSGGTFHFDTARARLPRPFFGMATLTLERKNLGSSRFNVSWYGKESSTSTHENISTGRPDVVLPVVFDERFMKGPNDVYLAVQNPHHQAMEVTFRVFQMNGQNIYAGESEDDHKTAVEWTRTLPSMGTLWCHVQREFILPAAQSLGTASALGLRIYSPGGTLHSAPSSYFFFHHRPSNVWSANHL